MVDHTPTSMRELTSILLHDVKQPNSGDFRAGLINTVIINGNEGSSLIICLTQFISLPTIFTSYHIILWCSFYACSAKLGTFVLPSFTFFLCSLTPSGQPVSPIY